MIMQRFSLPILLVFITEATALFYFLKDHKHQHSHEEVDYHHNYHHQDGHMQSHKHHEHKPMHMHKHQDEHKHHEHKPMHMHKHNEHKPMHMHKHQEEHKHHDHSHHHHSQGHHHEEHKHEHMDHHHHHHHEHKQEHMDHHHQHHKHQGLPHYEFKYGVRDPSTGDIKNQWEMRKGDEVKGEYSLLEADGTIRTVQYTAGKHTGFNAIVKKEGKAKHPIGTGGFPVVHHSKVKPVHPEADSKAKGSSLFADVDTSQLQLYNPSTLPTNHKAVFSGIDEQTNLLALYQHYPVHKIRGGEHRGFDYGINDYLTKRSYDLSKITEVLNASPTVDPIRAVRGSFVMGR